MNEKYVGFCDILGFSEAVEHRFDETVEVYKDFMELMGKVEGVNQAQVTIYSDSILVVADDLENVVAAIRNLSFAALAHDFLVRGGISHGKYWESKRDRNLFVVSDALIRAVRVERTISHPAVGFSPEVTIDLGAWISRFHLGGVDCPLLHFRGLTIANPFNKYWFQSAKTRVMQLMEAFPQYSKKYQFFLDLWMAVERNDLLIPDLALTQMIDLGLIEKRADG